VASKLQVKPNPVASSLGYAILALVAAKPQSGYDIARQMKLPLGFFWQAKHGQIYPELGRLETAGLVDFKELIHKIRPARKVYTATFAGLSALTKWVAEAPEQRPNNDELVIKAYALRRISGPVATTMLKAQIETHQNRLAALEQRAGAIETRSRSGIGVGSSRFGDYAILRRAIGSEREYIAWCRWLVREVLVKADTNPRPVSLSTRRLAQRRPLAGRQ
jgi:DNA-binding PadR family transcriptional regulator